MTPSPPGSPDKTAETRREALVLAAKLAIVWEAAWGGLWRTAAILALVAAASFVELWQALPPLGHAAALAVALGWAGYEAWRGLRGIGWPSREAALRRLEAASGFEHRPLTGAEDRLAAGGSDPLAAALWRRHQAAQAEAFARARADLPKPDVPRRDPYALRAVAVLALVAGGAAAGPDWLARLGAAFQPAFAAAPVKSGVAFDGWITPPAYTGLAPVVLAQSDGEAARKALRVPVGSEVTLRVSGANAATLEREPVETEDVGEVDREGFEPAGQTGFAATFPLERSERLRVTALGRELGRFDVTVVPDIAPAIAVDGEIGQTARQALRVPFVAADDYAVVSAEARIALAPEAVDGADPTAKPEDGTIRFALPVSAKDRRDVKGSAFEDLTEHPWAGLPVMVTLIAKDDLGQSGSSDPVRMVLPERVFTKPLARAVIEQRRELSRGLGAIPRVLAALDALALRPELFEMKPSHFLGLRSAWRRLSAATDRADLAEVQALLWDLALAIEEGAAAGAAAEMRRLQKELADALARGAPDAEIDRLMQELRQAMEAYMQALAQEMPEGEIPLVDGEMLSQDDLQRMLDEIEELARLGSREAAQELLSQLQELTERMQGAPAEPSERERQLAQAMKELDALAREQQKLLDETFREERRNEDRIYGDDASEPMDPQELARRQQELRERLEALREGMAQARPGEEPGEGPQGGAPQPDGEGEPQAGEGGEPENLGQAGEAMDGAAGSLGQGDLSGALPDQERAVELLRQAQREMREKLAEEQRRGGGMRIGSGRGQGRRGLDPAGRREGDGRLDRGDVEIPTERDMQRAREILEELRRRAGERDRPQDELDYIDRLLRRF